MDETCGEGLNKMSVCVSNNSVTQHRYLTEQKHIVNHAALFCFASSYSPAALSPSWIAKCERKRRHKNIKSPARFFCFCPVAVIRFCRCCVKALAMFEVVENPKFCGRLELTRK